MTIDDIKARREKITTPWKPDFEDTTVWCDTTGKLILESDSPEIVAFVANAPADIDWLVADRERFNKALGDAVTAHCTCGGGSPDDGCAACKVYHEIIEQTQGEK